MAGKFPKIGLALGGGGARGYAHVGVIKVLEKNGIPVDFISGSSAGALFGGVYAFLKESSPLEKVCFAGSWRKSLKFIKPSIRGGLIKSKEIGDILRGLVGNSSFKEMKIPLTVAVTDFESGAKAVISDGPIVPALQASMAFPLLFEPVSLRGKLFWDGALSDPVPSDVVRQMGADIVIAVNLHNKSMFVDSGRAKRDVFSLATRAIESLQYYLAQNSLKMADAVIEPEVKNMGLIGLKKIFRCDEKDVIEAGRKAAEEKMPEIKKLIADYAGK